MKLLQLNLLLSAAFTINASFDFESVNRQLQDRDLQNTGICATILNTVDIFDGCRCDFQFLRNIAEITCDNKCQGCSQTKDVCVVGGFTAFISGTTLQKVIFRVDHSGNDSSKRSLTFEMIEGSTSCNTFINNVKCSSCTLKSPNLDINNIDCIDAVHDCRNIGFGTVNSCDTAALRALPSTNPFSVLASDVLFPLDNCLAQSPAAPLPRPPVPVPAPVRAPVPVRPPVPAPVPVRPPVPAPVPVRAPVRPPVPAPVPVRAPVRPPVPAPAPVRPPVRPPAPAPTPVRPPVRPPVRVPTISGVPPKKTPPDDKDKNQLKLSNFDVGRGGLNRKLKSARGE